MAPPQPCFTTLIIPKVQDGRLHTFGHNVAAAVLDAGGNLVAFGRMDEAQLVTIDTAVGKAYTSVAIGAPSSVLHAASQPGAPLAGFQAMTMQPHPLVPFAGGVPITKDGVVVGALGVSGAATSEQDEVIAHDALSGNQ
jgi:uncharacterized protein GlcG (DUF336 family)